MDALDRRRFVASLIGGQSAALLAVLIFGGVLIPAVLAFLGSGAGLLLLGPPDGDAG